MSGVALAQGGKDAVDWSEVRTAYETTHTTLRQIADRFGISFSTTMKRAAREKWKKPESVIVETRKKIDGTINKVVEETARKMEAAVSEMAENALAEIQPWIEREKVSHIRRIVNAGKRGVERIEKLWDDNEPNDPRDESFAAASLERHDTIIRRNLGMSEGATPGTLNLNILAGGRAAIQILALQSKPEGQDSLRPGAYASEGRN